MFQEYPACVSMPQEDAVTLLKENPHVIRSHVDYRTLHSEVVQLSIVGLLKASPTLSYVLSLLLSI